MSEYATVIYRGNEHVAHLTINRPDAMNAFNVTLRAELAAALNQAAQDDDIRVVVLDAAGRGFGAGADLKEGLAENLTHQLNDEYRPVLDAIANCPKPVLSIIHGAAAGISLSVALMCDLTIMADDAFLLAPFSSIGLIPDGGAHFAIGRQIGYKRAYQMFVEATRMSAAQALELGLVNRVAASADVQREGLEWAAQLATRAPLSLKYSKQILRRALVDDYDAVFRQEAQLQQVCRQSEDAAEGISAFLGKRAPVFKGR